MTQYCMENDIKVFGDAGVNEVLHKMNKLDMSIQVKYLS